MTRVSSVVLALLAAVAGPAFAESENPRIPTTLPFDANVTPSMRAEGSVGYRSWDSSEVTAEADDLYVTGSFVFELLANLEVGAQFDFVSRDFDSDDLGSETGPSDVLAWGKYAFYRKDTSVFSAGALLSLPTGDEDYLLGTGNVEPGVYISGATGTSGGGMLQAHLGLRANDDRDIRGVNFNGKTSILVGFGGLLEPNPGLEVFAAFDLETEQVDDGETWARLAGGARWSIGEAWSLQGQAQVGLADAAPSLGIGFGVVWAP